METVNVALAHCVSSGILLKSCYLLPALLQLPSLTLSNAVTGNFAQSLNFSFYLPLRNLQKQSFLGAGCRKAYFHIGAQGKGWTTLCWRLFSWLIRELERQRVLGRTPMLWRGDVSLTADVGF